MTRPERVVVGSGAAMLGVSFLTWWEASALGYSVSRSAWDLEFLGARLAVLLSVAGAAQVLLRARGVDLPTTTGSSRPVPLILAVAALLLVAAQMLTAQDVQPTADVEAGWTFGLYLGLAVAALQTAAAAMSARTRGRSRGMSP